MADPRNTTVSSLGVRAIVALAFVTAPQRSSEAAGAALGGDRVSFAEVRVIIAQRCAACHSSAPTMPGLPGAPKSMTLDTPDEIRARADRILAMAVQTRTMPLGNVTGMTEEERETLGRWIRSGAPLR